MILVLLLVVVLVVAAGAGLLGVGVLSGDDRSGRTGGGALLSAPMAIVLVLVAVVGVLVLVGVGGRSGPAPAPTRTTEPVPRARLDRVSADIPVVRIQPADDTRFAPYELVSGIVPGAVVRVLAEGFGPHERGRIEQCVAELARQTACAEAYPVQFDGDGRADVQVAVRGDVAPGGCRAGQPTCLLVLSGTGARGAVQTVLVDRVAPGRVRVDPATRLVDGQTVEVSVTGFPPSTLATAVLCAPPAAYDARRCGAPGAGATFRVDTSGAGRTTLVVASGRLGPDGARCGPRHACGVAVVAGEGFVAAPVAPVAFARAPGVAYDTRRVVPGVVVAIALAAAAAWLAVRTDWRKPGEAATPELDAADLRADQDLDELFGTDAELEAGDAVPW